MSLEPREIKAKRVSTMETGLHCVLIADISVLRNAAKELIKNSEGFITIIVKFKNDKSMIHEQHYLMDNDWRQELIYKMLDAAEVPYVRGTPLPKKEAINKRLWIGIKEIHYINDENIVMEDDQPKIEHYIFRVLPFINGGKKPTIMGDPADNEGTASGPFLDYKNIGSGIEASRASAMVQSEIDNKESTDPSFVSPVIPTQLTPPALDSFSSEELPQF